MNLLEHPKHDIEDYMDDDPESPAIAVCVAISYLIFLSTIIYQQYEIIELQKDKDKYVISTDYMRLKTGVESGEQFPVINGDWHKCAKVDTE